MDQLCRIPAMTIQDPTVTRAELAIEEAELIDGGPAVSWGAIIAGALSAAALSFVLLAIGAAFGLSVTSPWDFAGREAGEAAAAAGIGTAIFLIVVHAITSGIGGYLAGRLRSKLIGLRGDETYFRDTAHGLVVWAVSALTTILMIAFLAFAAARGTVAVGTATLSAAGEAAGAAPALLMEETGRGGDNIGYFIDTLFRPAADAPATTGTDGPATTGGAATAPMALPEPRAESDARMEREEIGRIVRVALDGEISAEDRTYVAQIVAGETGMPQAEAE